jgi:ATP-binding cassette, subfamily B, bacterial
VLDFLRAAARYLRPYWRQAALIVLSQAPATAFITLQPLLLRALIDDAIVAANAPLAARLIAAMVGLLLLHGLGDLANHYLVARVVASVMTDLRLRIFTHLQRLSVSFYTRSRAGDLLARFTTDLEGVERALADDVPLAIYCGLTLLVGAGLLVSLEWRLALVLLVLLPAMPVLPRLLAPRAAVAGDQRQRAAARVLASMHENIAAQLVVRAFGLQKLTRSRFAADLDGLARASAQAGLQSGLLAASMTASGYALLALAMGGATFLAIRGAVTVGSVIAIFELLWFMVSAVQQLANVVEPFQRAASGLRRVQELLDERPEVAERPGAAPLSPLATGIRFEAVDFAFPGGETVLKDVDLTIPARRTVAVVGQSGSGKSTLLSLLLRFHDPTRGAVRFDGRDLAEATVASLAGQVGAVFQDSVLFDATLGENIRMGRPDASDADVEAAARAAGIHDFVAALPRGYDSPAGEGGARLSGGQRQRIALARALVRRPALLVLDEATSALDPETEAGIVATLEDLHGRQTIVSVTHRLATARDADLIVVMAGGRVVEEGSHESLVARNGLYTRLWDQQSGFVVSPSGRRASIEPHRLAAIPLFSWLDIGLLARFAARFTTVDVPPGQALFEEGEPGDILYVIVRGRVDVTRRAADGVDRQVSVLEDGDFFGEIALLDEVRRTATVRARTPCLLLSLDRADFRELLGEVPVLRQVFERVAQARRAELQDEFPFLRGPTPL